MQMRFGRWLRAGNVTRSKINPFNHFMMSLNVTEAPLFSLRGINVNLRHNLIEVKPESKEAVFQHLDTQETVRIKTTT